VSELVISAALDDWRAGLVGMEEANMWVVRAHAGISGTPGDVQVEKGL
jgi:hypothetical protein